MTTILIGIDGSPGSDDALAFAGPLAAASGATVLLAGAFRYDDSPNRASNLEYRAALQAETDGFLRRAANQLEGVHPARIRTVAVACTSPARALDRLAEANGAKLMVVGSSHVGGLGRIVPGQTAERLLHGAPCPVAVVPAGYGTRLHGEPALVGVAYDGTREAAAALHAATRIVQAVDGQLRVINVLDPGIHAGPATMASPGYLELRTRLQHEAQEELDRTIAALPAGVHAEPVFRTGDVAHELAMQSTGLDLLVAGSRGYGPVRSVLLGGVTGRLIRDAACPLLIVPRGHETPLAELFRSASTAAS